MTDCNDESESDLELLSVLMGDECLSFGVVFAFAEDGERALSRDEVRSLNAWPLPLPRTDFEEFFP